MKIRVLFFLLIFFIGLFFSISFIDHKIINGINYLFETKLNPEFWDFGLQHFGIELAAGGSILLLSVFINGKYKIILYLTGVIALFFIFLFHNAVNIPMNDDYSAILKFSNSYFFTENIEEKISLFVSFYCEYRLIITRAAIIILHFITGEINIKTLILIFNCCLPLILFLFYKSILSEKFRLEIILMIALLLFHFAYYDSIVFLSPGFHYQFSILFLMLSLFFICKKTIASQIAGAISAIGSALSFANGFLIFPLALICFIIKKRWMLFFPWLAAGSVISFIYFTGFPSSPNELFFFTFKEYFIFSCCFLGGAFQFMYKLHLPFIAGLLIWILFAVLTIKKYYNTNFFIYTLVLFVLLSSLAAAQFRLHFGLTGSISNRYGFFSLIATSASVIALFEICNEKKQKILMPVFLSLSVAYHLLSGIFFFPEVPIRKQKLETFINDVKNQQAFKPMAPIIPEDADVIVKESMRKRIYFP